MYRLGFKIVFMRSELPLRRCLAVLGCIAAAIFLQACSPTPDPCGPNDTQQGGSCARLQTNAGAVVAAFTRPPLCGDGVKTGDEECDGEDFGGVTCETIGAGSGTLLCNPSTCRFVFYQCSGSIGFGETIADATVVSENCTPPAEETVACGGCGQKNRTCQQNGVWSEWSVCNDSCGNPFCASQARLPSWEGSIGGTVQPLCGKPGCHSEANSYDSFVRWYNSAVGFENYLSPAHYSPPSAQAELDAMKCWISLGMPRTDTETGSGN